MPTTHPPGKSHKGESPEPIAEIGGSTRRPWSGVSSAHFVKLIEERGQTGFWTLDFFAREFTTSLGFYRLLGVHPSVSLGMDDLMKLVHPDDEPLQNDMYEAMRTGHAIDREFRIIRPDGTLRWMQAKAEVIVDAKGLPALAVGMLVDVTDQHAARQSVQEGWYRFKALFKAMAVIEFRCWADGSKMCWQGWDLLTGQSESESANGGWVDKIHPHDRENALSAWNLSLASGDVYAADYRVRCQDGDYHWFLARAAPVIELNGAIREWNGALVQAKTYRPDRSDNEGVDILKPAQIRAARALLNWTIEDLALQAGVSVSSVRRSEAETGSSVRHQLLKAVREAFQRRGVSITENPKGETTIHFNGIR